MRESYSKMRELGVKIGSKSVTQNKIIHAKKSVDDILKGARNKDNYSLINMRYMVRVIKCQNILILLRY